MPDRGLPWGWRALAVPAVVAGLRHAQDLAGGADAHLGCQFGDRGVGHGVDLGSVSPLSESVSKSACSFACTSTTKRALASSRPAPAPVAASRLAKQRSAHRACRGVYGHAPPPTRPIR